MKWIDKKNSQTFQVVHRSQRDPLSSHGSAHVLKPLNPAVQPLEPLVESIEGIEGENPLEQFNYDILFKDNYNYTQHLSEIGQGKFIKTTLKAQEIFGGPELAVGLMNQPENEYSLDTPFVIRDCLGALDDEDYLEELDDGFFEALDEDGEFLDEEELERQDGWGHVQKYFNLTRFKRYQDADGVSQGSETVSKHSKSQTNYSMTSSSIFRTEQLTLLDDRFDHLMNSYTQEELGELDNQETGDVELSSINDLMDQFLEATTLNPTQTRLIERKPKNEVLTELRNDLSNLVDMKYGYVCDSEAVDLPMPSIPTQNWDVTSACSGYTSIYNRPKLIRESSDVRFKFVGREKVPVVINDDEDQDSDTETVTPGINRGEKRDKTESKDEKRERKLALKKEQKERRAIKKSTTNQFKVEVGHQSRMERNHVSQGVKTHVQ